MNTKFELVTGPAERVCNRLNKAISEGVFHECWGLATHPENTETIMVNLELLEEPTETRPGYRFVILNTEKSRINKEHENFRRAGQLVGPKDLAQHHKDPNRAVSLIRVIENV
jgi:hypothetical protein